MLDLDGSLGEGGGQILRTSLALSLITRKPFHLCNIRARRPKPGLQAQHLMSVQAAAAIGQANVRGATLGSGDLVFEPGETVPGNFHFRIGTAGATSLVLHTVYLPLALAHGPSTVAIEGGTHVLASPCFHFLESTWRGYLGLLGIKLDLAMPRPGFYPRGGGLIEARIEGNSHLCGLDLNEFGEFRKVTGFSAVAGLPEHIAQRQAQRAKERLKKLKLKASLEEVTWPGGPGSVLALELPTTPVPTLIFALGARGKTAEKVADEAVDQVTDFLTPKTLAMDAHSADQILLPLALAAGPSRFRVAKITQHLLTNAAIIRQFLERDITCEGAEGSAGLVQITP